MKKILLSLLIGLTIISCKDKNAGNELTVSGLDPAKFAYTNENGKANKLYVLKNMAGMEVTVTNLGARIISITVPDKAGNMQNVLRGYDNIEPYQQLSNYTGAVLGRYAGRISNGEISIDRVRYDLRTNENKTMLNGGPRGFSTQYFAIEQTAANSLTCSYHSKATEEGFPGSLEIIVTYALSEDNSLVITYEAIALDRSTYVNLTNQLPFNLSGTDATSNAGQSLFVDAATYIETTDGKIPTGNFSPVGKTDFDFQELSLLNPSLAYDVTFVLNKSSENNPAAKLISESTGISLEIRTEEPGVYLMTTENPAAVILQAQHFSDSPKHRHFPSTVVTSSSPLKSTTIYKFGVQ